MIREQLAMRLKYFREKSGMTIYEVGEKIGKSGKTVSAWENGRGQPDADMLLTLCDLYKIDSIGDLYGETACSPASACNDLSEDEKQLLDGYRSLSNQGKEYMLQTLSMAVNQYKKHNSLSDMEASSL